MKTPKEYRDNLLNHIITKQMLVDCLYSVNKRAKNYRDKEREQRAYSRCHRYIDNSAFIKGAREKKLEMYRMKDILLQVLTPICIHKELLATRLKESTAMKMRSIKSLRNNSFTKDNIWMMIIPLCTLEILNLRMSRYITITCFTIWIMDILSIHQLKKRM